MRKEADSTEWGVGSSFFCSLFSFVSGGRQGTWNTWLGLRGARGFNLRGGVSYAESLSGEGLWEGTKVMFLQGGGSGVGQVGWEWGVSKRLREPLFGKPGTG